MTVPAQGINVLRVALARGERPSAAWIATWSATGEPVAAAWAVSATPHAMVHVLAVAEHPLVARARAVAHGRADPAVHAAAVRAVVPVPPDLATLCACIGKPLPPPVTALATRPATGLAEPSAFGEAARKYIAASTRANSTRARRADVAHFRAWCETEGRDALPASTETIGRYFIALAEGTARPTTHLSKRSPRAVAHPPQNGAWGVATILRRKSTLGRMHRLAGHADPTRDERVLTILKGIRAVNGKPAEKKAALLPRELRARPAGDPSDVRDALHCAVLLVGFAGALRRSELVGLDVPDVEWSPDGVRVTIRRSKSDALHAGHVIAILYSEGATCPVRALRAWLDAAGITDGAIFRAVRRGVVTEKRLGSDAVARIVKEFAAACGLDPAKFAGHSLRAGFITAAARAGVGERDIMRQSRHATWKILVGYIREAELFSKNPGKGLL